MGIVSRTKRELKSLCKSGKEGSAVACKLVRQHDEGKLGDVGLVRKTKVHFERR